MGGLGGRIGGSMEEVLGVDPCDKRIQKVLMNFKNHYFLQTNVWDFSCGSGTALGAWSMSKCKVVSVAMTLNLPAKVSVN